MNPSTETSVADDQLAAFIDRILRMKEEADAIVADIREIYAEAKANGFDKTQLGNVVTYLRKKDKDAAKLEEGEAVFDLYLGSYLATKNRAPRVRAYARASNGPEITEPQEAQAPAQAVPDDAPVASVPVESIAAVISTPITHSQPAPQAERDLTQPALGQVAPIQPETANEIESGERAVTGIGPESTGAIPGRELPKDASDAALTAINAGSSNGRTAGFDPADAGSSPAPASTVTAFTPKPLRPYCQSPGNTCGGMGRKHCFKCQKAHDEQQGAA